MGFHAPLPQSHIQFMLLLQMSFRGRVIRHEGCRLSVVKRESVRAHSLGSREEETPVAQWWKEVFSQILEQPAL